jgi:hypothetical protein
LPGWDGSSTGYAPKGERGDPGDAGRSGLPGEALFCSPIV